MALMGRGADNAPGGRAGGKTQATMDLGSTSKDVRAARL